MRVVIVWRENTDYARGVVDWMREFTHRTGRELESVNPDTKEGLAFARLYDVVRYPTIVALANDGSELQRWDGEFLPLINDVNFYLR